MINPRVFRGNTYSLKSTMMPWPTLDPVNARVTIEKAIRRRNQLSEAEKSQKEVSRSVKRYNKFIENNIKSRKNSSINLKKNELYTQTETYLEEILAHPIEESQYCQTEIEHDRPPSPLFIPKKSGIDAETQILDGELFDYDAESQPIIENMIGKVMEQALLELLEEQELQQLDMQKNLHLERKQMEQVELQRLEAEESRKLSEIEARVNEEKEKYDKNEVQQQESAASIFSKKIVDSITPAVLFELELKSHFTDPIEKEINVNIRDMIKENLKQQYEIQAIAVESVNELIEEALNNYLTEK